MVPSPDRSADSSDPARHLLRASDRLATADASVADPGLRSTLGFVTSELEDMTHTPSRERAARLHERLATVESAVTGTANVAVRRARQDLVCYREAVESDSTPAVDSGSVESVESADSRT
ncbi:DUF7553 family protein [Halomarina litorea]|uniref:DUF7553 family protein n=1 Tax=Halomarina litorea TaxID=2961595 RepID=UPI0020C23DE1|nr:hypothetical protein [Halomarina sp. BCD28]